jgi:hypothetical protein
MKLRGFFLMLCTCGIAAALQCGDSVSGNVILTADLNCVNQSGLTISAANTTINLNGHSILCGGAGFAGSCQGTAGAPPAGLPVGIFSNNHNNVAIQGPGTIGGFGFGVDLQGGTGLLVHHVNITGPAVPLAQNQRGTAIGIFIRSVACPDSPFAPFITGAIYSNQVANQVTGILLVNSSCLQLFGNQASNNNGGNGGGHGIAVAGGGRNWIYRNTVTNNGLNRNFDSGIDLTHSFENSVLEEANQNVVLSNQVSNNCGDGVAVGSSINNAANNNNILMNTAKFNGEGSHDGLCDLTRINPFHDLAQYSGSGNAWNPNNVCHTQTANIPAGVCNPNE